MSLYIIILDIYILINFNLKYELYQNYFLDKEQDKVQYHLYQIIKKKYYI